MSQRGIPYVLMRGGSSRGAYFRRQDLPQDLPALSKVLVTLMGAGHPLNIDGLGGGHATTTKVAMLSPAADGWADVDYFFAQVAVDKPLVDYQPTCGNILAGVGPAAIELGIIQAQPKKTLVKIKAVNTGSHVTAEVLMDADQVRYVGNTEIAGVPGRAAPVKLCFVDVVGSATSMLLPTGSSQNSINGIAVTCLDVAMPVVIARAEDFGLSGYESPSSLDDNKAFFQSMEAIRRQAARMMGLGDVSQSVIPKFAIIAKAQSGGNLSARYFMPWKTHPAMAVTGAQCIACCGLIAGTVAGGLLPQIKQGPVNFCLEHAAGTMDINVDFSVKQGNFELHSVGLIRTARKIAQGQVFVPDDLSLL